MAQNITFLGASYSNVPAVELPKTGGGTASFTDVTDTTAAASDVAQGKYFYTAAGVRTQGTSSGGGGGGGAVIQDQDGYLVLDDDAPTQPTLITKSITANGTYSASSDSADGYSSVTVNVSGGGGLVYETGTFTPTTDVAATWITFSNSHTEPPFYYAVFDATGTYDGTSQSNYMVEFIDVRRFSGNPIYSSSTSLIYARYTFMYRASSSTSISSLGGNLSTQDVSGYATSTEINASTGSSSRYWRAGRTYKWIAAWAPTS